MQGAEGGKPSAVMPMNCSVDWCGKAFLKEQWSHSYLGSNQQLSSYIQGQLNRREVRLGSINLASSTRRVRTWIQEKSLLPPLSYSSIISIAF